MEVIMIADIIVCLFGFIEGIVFDLSASTGKQKFLNMGKEIKIGRRIIQTLNVLVFIYVILFWIIIGNEKLKSIAIFMFFVNAISSIIIIVNTFIVASKELSVDMDDAASTKAVENSVINIITIRACNIFITISYGFAGYLLLK